MSNQEIHNRSVDTIENEADEQDEIKSCDVCGCSIKNNDNFCGFCGVNLREREGFKNSYAECLELLFQNEEDSNNISVEVKPDLKSAKLSAVLNVNELDKDLFPENFSISVDILIKIVVAPDYMTRIIKKDHDVDLKNIFKFEEAIFKIGEKEYSLRQFCPKEISVFLSPAIETSNFRDPNNDGLGGDIVMNDFSSPMGLIGLLHEIGHDIEQSRKSRIEKRRSSIELNNLAEKPFLDRSLYLEAKVDSERDAWAEALKISRKNKMSLEAIIEMCAQASLATYQKKEDKLYDNEILYERGPGFTKIRRNEIRNQKRLCPDCGHLTENSFNFCRVCGSHLVFEGYAQGKE